MISIVSTIDSNKSHGITARMGLPCRVRAAVRLSMLSRSGNRESVARAIATEISHFHTLKQ